MYNGDYTLASTCQLICQHMQFNFVDRADEYCSRQVRCTNSRMVTSTCATRHRVPQLLMRAIFLDLDLMGFFTGRFHTLLSFTVSLSLSSLAAFEVSFFLRSRELVSTKAGRLDRRLESLAEGDPLCEGPIRFVTKGLTVLGLDKTTARALDELVGRA